MSADQSVTHLLRQLQSADGDHTLAQEQLWQRYFERLVGLARKKLRNAPQRVEDEEDVVLAALESFFRGARAGRFPELRDRTNLWPLLVTITARKALNQLKRQHAQKRGGGAVRGESVFISGGDNDAWSGIESVVQDQPTPEFAAEVAEQCEQMLTALGDETLRRIALLKLEGYTNQEIADQLGITTRTVERKLQLIRQTWSEVPEA